MEHSQFKVWYYPKRDTANANVWEETPVDLYSYLDFDCQETTEKRQDGSNLPFIKKVLFEDKATLNVGTGVYTLATKTLEYDNKYRWHTLIDQNNNRFVIQSNTTTTITLAPAAYFTRYGTPVAGQIRLEIPDFESDDVFVILGWKVLNNVYSEPTDFADKVMFMGQVVARQIKNDNRGTQTLVKLANTTEELLKTTQTWAYSDTEAPNFFDKIEEILSAVNGRNPGNIQIILDPGHRTTTTQGGAFKEFTYYKDNSSAADAIYDLITTPNTGDVVDYYCYVRPVANNLFYLVVEPKLITATSDVYEGTHFDFLEWANDKADVISSLVFRCGRDCNGNNITQVITGSSVKGSKSFRYAEDLAGGILDKEFTDNPSDFDTNISKYPISYPYTTSTSVSEDEVAALGPTHYSAFMDHDGVYTVSNNGEFNKFIRYLAKAKAVIKGKAFLQLNNRTRDKLKVSFFATPAALIPGDANRFNIPTIGWIAPIGTSKDYRKRLRLINKTVSVNSNGITIVAEYIEDERDAITNT